MARSFVGWMTLGAVIVLSSTCALAQTTQKAQVFPLRDTVGLIATKAKMDPVTYLGRPAVRLTVEGEDGDGIAILPGTDFQDGTIEAEIALKPTTPPGVRYPGFVGIAFRSRDASHFEMFYVRPGNSAAPDQLQRNHAVQYVAGPDFGWYRLRREWPSVYESTGELAMETWTKLKIEVAGRTAKLYLNGSSKPSLVVDGLKGEDLHGSVGLWSFTNEESYFSNVRITPAAAMKLENGSDVAGVWELQFGGDAGGGGATMELRREEDKVTGTWSGPLGTGREITGTWRNGYVELIFAGEWPKDSRQGAPGPVHVHLAGWIDGNTAKGRISVVGRNDGQWSAKRKE